MSKIDYSDFYKFLVSLGFTLIGLSVVIPWLFLREHFDLLVPAETIEKLTPTAQCILALRNGLLLDVYPWIPIVSIFLAVSGLAFLIFGLFRWQKRQEVLDKQEDISLRKAEVELKDMSAAEVLEKTISEAREDIPDNSRIVSDDTNPELSDVSRYTEVESIINAKLSATFESEYVIMSNQRVDGAQFDNVLRRKDTTPPDIIIETKYSRKGFGLQRVQNQVVQLILSMELYANVTKRQTIAIMVLVAPKDSFEDGQFRRYENRIIEERQRRNAVVSLYLVYEEDLAALDFEELRRDITMTRQLVNSSNISSIGYEQETKTLEVQFKNGSIYRYYDVPEATYDGLMIAESHGKYLAAHIKGVYRYKQIR